MNTDGTSSVKAVPHRSKVARVAWMRSIGLDARGVWHQVRCAYCDCAGRVQLAHVGYCTRSDVMCIDHVVPLSKGGADDGTNFAFACQTCNGRKGSRTDWSSPNSRFIAGRFVKVAR